MGIKVTKTSPLTMKDNTMDLDITIEQLELWQKGDLIQNVMPNLTADEGEFLMTGHFTGEFDKLWEEG